MLPIFMQSLSLPGDGFLNSSWPILLSVIVGVFFGLRHYFRGAQCRSNENLNGKVAIVTGSSSGIGLELTRSLVMAGAKVIMACRNKSKVEKIILELRKTNPQSHIKFIELNLASFASVKKFVTEFKLAESKLDILINNGGILNHQELTTIDGHEIHFQVNYLSHFLLTNLLMDVLQTTPGSRVINNTSHAYKLTEFKIEGLVNVALSDVNANRNHLQSYESNINESISAMEIPNAVKINNDERYAEGPSNTQEFDLSKQDLPVTSGVAYAQSKLALILFTKSLASKYENSPSAYTANPGVVRTNLYRNMPFRSNPILAFMLAPFLWFFMKTPSDGAQTALHCATSNNLKSGEYFCDCAVSRLEANASSERDADSLWSSSVKACGL